MKNKTKNNKITRKWFSAICLITAIRKLQSFSHLRPFIVTFGKCLSLEYIFGFVLK